MAGFSNLRLRLLLLILLATIPAFGLILYTGLDQRRMAAAQAQREALRLVRRAASDHERLIEGGRQLLFGLAQVPRVGQGDPTACNAFLAALLKQYPFYANLTVTARRGEVLCSAVPLTQPVNTTPRPWFQRAIQTRSFALGDYQIGRITGKSVLVLASPVLNRGGQVEAVVAAALDLAWLNQFAARAELSPGATLTVFDRHGTILVHYPDPEKWVGRTRSEDPMVKAILTQPGEGTTITSGLDGIPRLIAFTRLQGAPEGEGVYVAVGIPRKIVFAELNRLFALNLAGLGIVTLLALVAARVGGELFILRPVNALVSATRRLASGDLSARTGLPPGGELGQLARAFDEMAEALDRHAAERKQTEEALVRRTRQLEAVRAVGTEITRELDLPTLLGLIVRRAAELVGAVSGTVYLWDEGAQVLIPRAWSGLGEWMGEVRLKLGEGVTGTVAEWREGIIVNDYRASPYVHPLFLEQSGVTAVLAEPLLYRDRLLGVITIDNEETGRAFSGEDRELMALFATQAAIALENARLFEQVRAGRERLQVLSRKLVEVQEVERRHIARELHDEIGQVLTGLKLTLEMSSRLPADAARTSLGEAQTLVNDLIAQVRELSLDLRPAILDDLGLLPALLAHFERYTAKTRVRVAFEHAGLGRRFPSEVETAAYRIVQEALTNIARHAGVGEASVGLWADEERLGVQIEDGGAGFDPDAVLSAVTSSGLVGMRERAVLVGGDLSVESAPGAGTRVMAELPLGRRFEKRRKER